MWGIIGTFGFILVLGICNDIATFSQIITCSLIGLAIMLISALFARHRQYHIDFVAPNGTHKKVRAYNLISKFIAIHKYHKLGYNVYSETEWEVTE